MLRFDGRLGGCSCVEWQRVLIVVFFKGTE